MHSAESHAGLTVMLRGAAGDAKNTRSALDFVARSAHMPDVTRNVGQTKSA